MKIESPILAIDYGSKHIGLAISDYKGILATPLEVLSTTKNTKLEDIIENIKNICSEYKVKTILIGKPQTFQETYSKTEEKINKFTKKIEEYINIPVIQYDESYSTTTAQNMLLSLGQHTKRTRNKIDMIAACVFLQEFLNSENEKNEKVN